jgi:predicted transcriptional regulator with HTH domain
MKNKNLSYIKVKEDNIEAVYKHKVSYECLSYLYEIIVRRNTEDKDLYLIEGKKKNSDIFDIECGVSPSSEWYKGYKEAFDNGFIRVIKRKDVLCLQITDEGKHIIKVYEKRLYDIASYFDFIERADSNAQRRNHTLYFHDTYKDCYYGIYANGYVRRFIRKNNRNSFVGYQLNKTEALEINGKKSPLRYRVLEKNPLERFKIFIKAISNYREK